MVGHPVLRFNLPQVPHMGTERVVALQTAIYSYILDILSSGYSWEHLSPQIRLDDFHTRLKAQHKPYKALSSLSCSDGSIKVKGASAVIDS